MLDFIGKFMLSIALACLVSVACSAGITSLLFSLADVFGWHYKGDVYWIFNITIISLIISWIITFGICMSKIK